MASATGLSDHDYAFEIGQEVETTRGLGRVTGRSKFGFPEGIYWVSGFSEPFHAAELAAIEDEAAEAA